MKMIILTCALALAIAVEADNHSNCYLPVSHGSCSLRIKRFFYEPNTGLCQEFYYAGCGGGRNNYRERDECEQSCSTNNDLNNPACGTPIVLGSCDQALDRYYFDAQTERCEHFYYAGCRGNANNFISEDECIQHCSTRK